jgi:hypothetical protein
MGFKISYDTGMYGNQPDIYSAPNLSKKADRKTTIIEPLVKVLI